MRMRSILFASAAVLDWPPQDVLGRPTVDILTDHDAIIENLLATYGDDPVQIIAAPPPGVRLSVETFTHTFPQPSVVARFEPFYGCSSSNPAMSLPRTMVGAHQDSANYLIPLFPAPGADDDGAGTVTILEAFRALV
ncbi:hypothetical protein EDB19DRAFT_1908646 [Suillus lakei]|nr:hypothetical protein EDB19DRAFT_1908646 [Suillus lakei]